MPPNRAQTINYDTVLPKLEPESDQAYGRSIYREREILKMVPCKQQNPGYGEKNK